MKQTFVKPRGIAASAELVIVRDQPSVLGVMNQKFFIGKEAGVLDCCLRSAGFRTQKVYQTAVFKDQDQHLTTYCEPVFRNQKLVDFRLSSDGQRYVQELKLELEKLKTRTIVAIDNVPLFVLTNRVGIQKWRGSILDCELVPGKKVIPVLSPMTVVKGQYLNERLLFFDLKRARKVQLGKWKQKKFQMQIKPTFSEVQAALEELKTVEIFDFDIEIWRDEVSCFSLTWFSKSRNDVFSMCVPLVNEGREYWTVQHEYWIINEVTKLLENQQIKLRGQNLTFDCAFWFRRYGGKIVQTMDKIEDTMIAQGTIMHDYPKGLDFVCSIHTDQIPYYKDDGKRWFPADGKWDQLFHYNNHDTRATWEVWPNLDSMIQKQKNEKAYRRKCAVVGPLVFMMEHGIRVDIEGIRKRRLQFDEEEKKLQAKLDKVVGHPLNANSPSQVSKYFYKELKLKTYKYHGKSTTNEKAMKRFAGRGFEAARLILKLKKITKLRSYLYESKFDVENDGSYRYRCSFNPVGTKFSRLSSSENIFGTGGNTQNWPHDLQQYLTVDEGYVGFALDLGQAENRCVAYLARAPKLIKAFENGTDVHSLAASWVFDKPLSDVTREDGTCELGDGTHSERFWGKKANHAGGYDIGVDELAVQLEISHVEAKFLSSKWHAHNPEVRKNYHREVREQINYNQTITNLRDRKVKFLGEVCTKMYKEAYSCSPQGTVGDLVDEFGLNFVYYDERFTKVELLNQVHDEIVFQIPLSLGWKKITELVKLIQQNMQVELETDHGLKFTIPVDVTVFKRCKRGVELSEVTSSTVEKAWQKCLEKERNAS